MAYCYYCKATEEELGFKGISGGVWAGNDTEESALAKSRVDSKLFCLSGRVPQISTRTSLPKF